MILFGVSLTLSLYNQTDTFILGFINEGKEEVGSYSVGIKGIDIVIGVLSNLSTVFVPRSAYYYEKEDKRFFNNLTRYSFNICLFIVLPAIVMMSILSNPICSLISGSNDLAAGEFSDAHAVLTIVSSMMLTYSLAEMIYGQILIPMKKEKYYLIAISFGVILNVSLSIILGMFVFKTNPAIGVAIGTIATDIIIFIYLILVTKSWTFKAIFNKNTGKLLIATGLILVATLLLKDPIFNLFYITLKVNYSFSMLYQLVSLFILNLIIYLGSLLLLKEDLVYSFIKKTPKAI
jgi:O-antigen/teichoic acid export membrane protein